MKNNIGPTCQPSMFGNNHVQHAWKQLCSVWQAALLSLILFRVLSALSTEKHSVASGHIRKE